MMMMTACPQIWITVQAKGKDCIAGHFEIIMLATGVG